MRDAVDDLRARGVEIEVVSPASFRHFGIAYGAGIAGNLRAPPWKALLLPSFLRSYTRAARARCGRRRPRPRALAPVRAARAATGKPYLLTDARHGRRARPARAGARPAARARGADGALRLDVADGDGAAARRARGARRAESGSTSRSDRRAGRPAARAVRRPAVGGEGRARARRGGTGLPLVVVGDGPLRDRVPGALGFVPPAGLGA